MRFLLFSIATLLTAGTALAADTPGAATSWTATPWGSRVVCPVSELEKGFAVPAADRERIIHQLHPEAFIHGPHEVEVPCALVARPWKARPGHTVVALETRSYIDRPGPNRPRRLYLGLYLEPLGAAAPVARTAEPLTLPGDADLSMLDFAPYAVAPGTVAFGLRDATRFIYAGGGGMDETLHLFRVDGETIKLILSTLLRSSSLTAGEWNDDGSRNHQENGSETAASISVLPNRTAGFFDLRKSLHGRSAILRWDGGGYRMKGKDPVTSVNAD